MASAAGIRGDDQQTVSIGERRLRVADESVAVEIGRKRRMQGLRAATVATRDR